METIRVDDDERARDLARMKRVALALLFGAAVVFLVARGLEENAPGWGYVRATAEAAMVGALADWFAVTALFRHPLGIPIPHTAIIPRRKDALARSLADFVETNFLTPDVVADKVAAADLAPRLGAWLEQPDHARSVGEYGAGVLRGVLEVVDDADVGPGIQTVVVRRIREADAAELLRRLVDLVIEGGHQQVIYDSSLQGAMSFLRENTPTLRRRLAEESPWWVPEAIDDRVFARLAEGFLAYLDEIRRRPDHELRRYVDQRVLELADRLRTDPELHARAESLKQALLDHPEFQQWSAGLWASLRSALEDVSADPESELRQRFERAVISFGTTLQNDPVLQAKVGEWLESAARFVTETGSSELGELIEHTIDRWDAGDTARRIELQVGRDLQFIRINGTIVGGLAGLTIHTLGEVFF